MKNQLKTVIFLPLLLLLLTACTPMQTTKIPIHTNSSKDVVFSDIRSSKSAKGIIVNGNVRKKISASKRARIPGHIHIILTSRDGEELETIKARTHRKYGNSKHWHFDGILKTLPPEGSVIVVKHHQHQ